MEQPKQTYKTAKKGMTGVISVFLAGVLGLVGFSGARKLVGKKVPGPTSSEITTEYITDDEQEIKLLLSEDFDINNKEAVRKRAKAIYDISEKNVSVDDIVNIIYLMNEKFDSITFKKGADDLAKFVYIQNLIPMLTDLLNDNLKDDTNALADTLDKGAKEKRKVNNDEEVYSYMFMSKGNDKKLALEIANVVIEQLDNIEKSNVNGYESAANKYHELYQKVSNLDTTNGFKILLLKEYKTKNILFVLTDKQIKDVDKNENLYTNKLFTDIVEALDIDTNEIINDADKNGYAKEVPKNGNSYNSEDSKDSLNHANNNGSGKDEVVDQGGANLGSSSSVIGGGDVIGTVTETSVSNNGKSDTTEIIEGGDVIETSTKIEIVSIPNDGEDIIIEEGGEPIEDEQYTTYVDDEEIPVMTEDDFENAKAIMQTVGGFSGSLSVFGISLKKRRSPYKK